MRALNSHFVLIDLHTSWNSAQQIPTSAFSYLEKCRAVAPPFSAAIRRTHGRRGKITASGAPAPEIRRPREWSTTGNGFFSVSSNTASTSSSGCLGDEMVSDMDLFLEIVPVSMRHELFRHEEIGELIEVVMDLGRKPLARFPSGDWVISEHMVKIEDLHHAISKVVLKWFQ